MENKSFFRALAGCCLALILCPLTWGYEITKNNGQPITWNAGTVTMQIQLGAAATLSDGSTYNSSVQAALQIWNAQLGTVQFANQVVGAAAPVNNSANEIGFDSAVYGTAFDANVLAITVYYYSNTPRSDGTYRRTQADIILNNAYTWDSYRGPLRAAEDIQRVALHELGHVFGITHPDLASPPQSVTALMNSHVSNLDTLAADDIAGAQSLYGAPIIVPVVTSQPVNQSVYAGQTAQFSITATGNPTFQWQRLPSGGGTWGNLSDGGNYSGVTSSTISISAVPIAANGDQFRCVVTNGVGSATSNAATLTVTASVGPSILTQPVGQTVVEGNSVTFTVSAGGVPAPTFQWRKGGANISGATASSFTITSVAVGDAGSYTVVVTNVAGSITSNAGVLTVTTLPVITALSPVRQVLNVGQSLSLSVSATGTGSLTFRWWHNGLAIPGSVSSSFFVGSTTRVDSGYYFVEITDDSGTRRSIPIFVIVSPVATQVLTWGSGAYAVPPNLTDTVAIADGLILRANGTILDLKTNVYQETRAPVGLDGVVAISAIAGGGGAGGGHSLALKADGTVVSWGVDSYGETLVPSGLGDVVAISAGGHHSLALKSDGTVVSWGNVSSDVSHVPLGLSGVVAIAAGTNHSLALKADGTVVAWGDKSIAWTLPVPVGLSHVVAIAAGAEHSLAVRDDGSVVAWGNNAYSNCTGTASFHDVASVLAGYFTSLAVNRDGTLVGVGGPDYGQIPIPGGLTEVIALPQCSSWAMALRDASRDIVPKITVQPVNQTVMEAQNVTFAVSADGGAGLLYYQWRFNGVNISGALGPTLTLSAASTLQAGAYDVIVSNHLGAVSSVKAVLSVTPTLTITSLSPARQVILPGGSINLSVSATGVGVLRYQWLKNGRLIPGATDTTLAVQNLTLQDSGYFVVRITSDYGTKYSPAIFIRVAPSVTRIIGWGDGNTFGGIAIPPALKDAIAISASADYAFAINRHGTVASWGILNDIVSSKLTEVVALSSGGTRTLALRSDGSVIGWSPAYDTGLMAIPSGLTNVVAISASPLNCLALKSDGTVVAWGDNGYGQSDVPVGLRDVVQVVTTGYISYALKADGTVVTWGAPYYIDSNAVAALTGVVFIDEKGIYCIKRGGTLEEMVPGWGYGLPLGLIGVCGIATGNGQVLALKTDGSVVAWGTSGFAAAIAPTDIAGAFAVSVGDRLSLALCEWSSDTAPLITTQPINQTITVGKSVTFTVKVSSRSAAAYQWYKNGSPIAGATSSTYSIANAEFGDGTTYQVITSNESGSTASDVAVLSVVPPMRIITQPLSHASFVGGSVSMICVVSGTPAPTYQWQKGGINIPGATNSTLTLNNIQLSDAGSFGLVATNADGSVTSRFARLVVLASQQNAITYATTRSSTGVTAGGIVNFDYFVTNVGTKTWGAHHYLSIRDVNNTFVAFSSLIGILPGETTTANLNFPAPTTPGTYTYYVQGLEDGVEFFSTQTTVTLTVLAPVANAITYNTTSFPVSAAPGSNVIFTYNVTNTGTATWGASHNLTLKDSNGTTLSTTPLTVLAPGASKTVNLSLTVPSTPGTYHYTVQASQTGVGNFGTQANLTLVALAPQPNAIVYNRVRYPDEVAPGTVLNLKYTLSNAGTQAWGVGHYASLRDSAETYLSFIPLNGTAAGGTKTIEFTLTAPTTPGTYTYYVQALEDGIEFFSTQDVVIVKVVALPLGNAISYNTSTIPVTAAPGATVNFTANVTNRGTRTWGATHYLSFRDVDNTFLAFPPLNGVAPGASRTSNLSFTAPNAPGIYTYTLQAFEDGVTFFEMADTVVLMVQ